MIQQDILSNLKDQVNERKLGVSIAEAYGCTPPYVSQVLSGTAKYNFKLIEVALNILEQDKQKKASMLSKHAKRLGLQF